MSSLDWQAHGVCRQVDPDLWFPNKGETSTDAKAICRRCEVKTECLEYALAHDERWGVWGGKSEQERRRLKKQVAA